MRNLAPPKQQDFAFYLASLAIWASVTREVSDILCRSLRDKRCWLRIQSVYSNSKSPIRRQKPSGLPWISTPPCPSEPLAGKETCSRREGCRSPASKNNVTSPSRPSVEANSSLSQRVPPWKDRRGWPYRVVAVREETVKG